MSETLRIVSVSGGKDSTALYLWAMDQFGKDGFRAVFADTGHEHPVTLNYIRHMHTMAGGPEVEWVKADFADRLTKKGIEASGNPFLDMMLWKGRAPSSKAQFCTEHVKLKPIQVWLEAIRGDSEVFMYTGIRAGESERRSKMAEREWSDLYDCESIRPLLRWTEAQVFDFLKDKGVPPNPLYEAGFSRVGCFPCIHSRKSELANLPEWAWQKLEEWEARLGRSWFAAGTVPGVFIPTIADARDWAKTTRGGRQFDMFAEDQKDVPTCMSTWGQCE
jgi:3'-phosphoadenosine 5'-phosphosulfate sulfotransferase (PAPS reductase)/FAD synthetase